MQVKAIADLHQIVVVGCGGIGGWLVHHLYTLAAQSAPWFSGVDPIYLVDHDLVEPRNLMRQNFQPHEVGMNKASALALRYNAMLGRQLFIPVPQPIEKFEVWAEYSRWVPAPTVVLSGVDNGRARRCIYDVVLSHSNRRGNSLPIYWIDGGNAVRQPVGQVIVSAPEYRLGTLKEKILEGFGRIYSPDIEDRTMLDRPNAIISSPPSPATWWVLPHDPVQDFPDLFNDDGEEEEGCAIGEQSPMANKAVALRMVAALQRLFDEDMPGWSNACSIVAPLADNEAAFHIPFKANTFEREERRSPLLATIELPSNGDHLDGVPVPWEYVATFNNFIGKGWWPLLEGDPLTNHLNPAIPSFVFIGMTPEPNWPWVSFIRPATPDTSPDDVCRWLDRLASRFGQRRQVEIPGDLLEKAVVFLQRYTQGLVNKTSL